MTTDTKTLRKDIRRIKKVKTWQLVCVLVLLLFVAATFLRLNNIGMVERRSAVYAAEKNTDNDSYILTQRLYDLQRYSAHHMNADTGRIALDAKYKRDEAANYKAFMKESDSANKKNTVVSKVRATCDARGKAEGWGVFTSQADPNYVACINSEWAKYPASEQKEAKYQPLSTLLYYHEYESPLWSPDYAGFSVLACLLVAIVIVVRWVTIGVLKLIVKLRYRRAIR